MTTSNSACQESELPKKIFNQKLLAQFQAADSKGPAGSETERVVGSTPRKKGSKKQEKA